MPRAKMPGASERKSRSRRGCWPCKERKVKCGEENADTLEKRGPCVNCQRLGHACDYGIRLNWEGRSLKQQPGVINFSASSISVSTGSTPPPPPLPAALPSTPSSFQQYPIGPSSSHATFQTPPYQSQGPTSYQLQFNTPSCQAVHSPDLSPNLPPAYRFPVRQVLLENEFSVTVSTGFKRQREDVPSTPGQKPLPISSRPRCIDSGRSFANSDLRPSSPATSTIGDSSDSTSNYRPTKRRMLRIQGREFFQENFMSPMQPPASITYPSHQNEHSANYGFNSSTSNPSTLNSAFGDDPSRKPFSVASLLSGPPGPHDHKTSPKSNFESYRDIYTDLVSYGVDRGIKDRDIPENDDFNALSGSSPDAERDHAKLVVSPSDLVEFGFGLQEDSLAFKNGSYYDSPVEVSIPRSLHPLPAKLLSNKMNMLYFHHFLNHTAKCLLPHNCASNPFRMILPFMAIEDENLMNLFLAYSAFHRCKLLGQPVPATRIALWMQDVFANLRKALDNPAGIISNSNLAAAIMLASLDIKSPNAFGVTVPWQSHLDTARQMIVMRGGPKGMRVEGRSDKVTDFLWSWFAYLDVIGNLSGGENSSWLLDYHVEADTDYEINCVLGFTSKCIRILAKIAALAQICDRERIQATAGGESASEWRTSDETLGRAAQLEMELLESRIAPTTPCTHMQSSGEVAYQWDAVEMGATNQAFHWAGHVHLHRRILGKSSDHQDVQSAVGEIFSALFKVRDGSNAEGCLLFPMFTAGCDSLKGEQKTKILNRMKRIEVLGMSQVYKARTLMEKVWDTGRPWETLVAGEFFG